MTSTSDLANQAGSHVSDLSREAGKTLRQEAHALSAATQDKAASAIENAAHAADAAAAQFDPASIQAEAARQLADHIEGVAQKVRSTDLDGLVRGTSEFARQNPALFIGAAAAIGFAATRFLKARKPQHVSTTAPSTDPWAPAYAGSRAAVPEASHQHTTVLAEMNGGRGEN